MQEPWSINIIWWITAVELPALAGLFWMNWNNRRDAIGGSEGARRVSENGLCSLRESLSSYKLEVAKSYASISYLKEVERRLTRYLTRIEDKLDNVVRDGSGGGS